MSEAFLRQIIIEELEYEPSLDATHIGVAVEKGIVTLTGHVASFAQKQAAIAAVEEFMASRASPTRLRYAILSRRKLTMMRLPSGRSMFWAGIASYPITRSRLSYETAG